MTPDEIAELVDRELEVRRQVEAALRKKADDTSGFWKHPAVLLVLTFLFTGVVGSGLTTCWQDREWVGQQEYNATADATKERLATMNLATTEVATAFASVEDVLHLVTWEWPKKSQVVTLEERAQYWREQSRRWRVADKVLRARIRANFEDEEISNTFADISEDRELLGNYMQNLLLLRDQNRTSLTPKKRGEVDDVTDFMKRSQKIVALVTIGKEPQGSEKTSEPGKLEKLTRLMLKEIERRRIAPQRSLAARFLCRSGTSHSPFSTK